MARELNNILIKDGSKLKQKLTYHLFNSILRGRKYLEYVLRKEGNYSNRWLCRIDQNITGIGYLNKCNLQFDPKSKRSPFIV